MTETRLLLPLQIGHESEMLDTLTPCGQTQFRWTVFVRSVGALQFTDRSFINKVVFELHPDFANPKRFVTEPPFEVTETGYAGFMIPILISFTGVSQTYKLMYDMNLVLEKQSKHCVEQLLLIKQPSNEFYELAIKYGGRVKKEKRRKEKHSSGHDHDEVEIQPQKNETSEGKRSKRKKKIYIDDYKAETSKGTPPIGDCKAIEVAPVVAAKNHTPRKVQKPYSEEIEEKFRTNGRSTPSSDRSKSLVNGKTSPITEQPKSSAAKSSPFKDRSKNGNVTPSSERPRSSNRSSPPSLERPKSTSKEKLSTPNGRHRVSQNDKLSSPSDSSKNFSDDQSPPAKKRKQEMSLDTLLSVQKRLMDLNDAERMLAVVDAIFSSAQWPVPSLEYSEDTNLLSFDLFSLDPALILKLEELCR